MSLQCACFICSGKLGASKRLQEALGTKKPVLARNFDSPQQAEKFSLELSKQLRAKGVEIDDWRKVGGRHWFGLYPKGVNLKTQINSALSKLGYAPWLFNKKVLTHNKFGYPLLVTDTEIVLLGQSVPRWGKIFNTLKSVISAKPLFTTKQPLGYLPIAFTTDNATKISALLKSIGFVKESDGLLVSVEDDLEVSYTKTASGVSGKLQQPQSELLLDERKFEVQRKPEAPDVTKAPEPPVTKPTVVTPKPATPVVVPQPEPPRRPDVILTKPDEILLKKDNTQVPHIGIPANLGAQYTTLSYGDKAQHALIWMRNLWTFLNQHKFEGQLKMPNISYIKNVARMRTRGYWQAYGRELKIAPRLFNAPLPVFIEIFLHEMCHQAVSEIDKTVDRTEQGHGPHWRRWVVKVGLNPARYDHNNSDIYLSQEDQVKVKKQREKAEENKKELALVPEYNFRNGRVVRIALERGSKVVTGVIVNQQTSKYAVIVDPTSGQWWNVPPQLIYKADPETDQSVYATEVWQHAIQKVQQHFQVKKEVRQIKKLYRTRFGY